MESTNHRVCQAVFVILDGGKIMKLYSALVIRKCGMINEMEQLVD
jgi:hypothetical protein